MEFRLSIKQVLRDILCIKDQVTNHFKGVEKYGAILPFLNKKDYYNDDGLPVLTLKEIEKETGIKPYQLRKQIKEIYHEFFNTYLRPPIKFKETIIYFNLHYFKRYAMFRAGQFTCVPRINEHVTVPFLKAKVRFTQFYVKDIRHDFSGNTHTINIDLKGGWHNKYYHLRKDERISKGEIGLGIDAKYYEYEIKEMLVLKRI